MKLTETESEMEKKGFQEFSWMTLAACAWLGLYPLINFGTYATITRDKCWSMMILTGVTVGCMIADFCAHNIRKPKRIPCILISLLFAWIIGSCITSRADPSIWWIGKQARWEGLATQLCYFVLFFLFSNGRIERRALLGAASAGVLLFGIVVIFQRAGYNPFHLFPSGLNIVTNPEFQGTIGNVDMSTGYLVMIFGILNTDLLQYYFVYSERAEKDGSSRGIMLPLFTAAGTCMTLYLLVTMGVQFGMLSLLSYGLYLLMRILPRRNRILFFLVFLLLLLFIVWLFPFEQEWAWELHEILHGRAQLSFGSNRLAVWYYSLQLAGKNLLFGGGSGTFLQRLNSFLEEHQYVIPSSQGEKLIPTTFDSPHNEYLAYLVNHGLPALILFCALVFYLCFRPLLEHGRFLRRVDLRTNDIKREEREKVSLQEDLRGGAVCYAVQAFFSFSVCIIAPIFWVVTGMLAEGLPTRR